LGVVLVAAVAYGYAQQRNIRGRFSEFQNNENQVESVKKEIEALKERVEQAKQRVQNMENDPIEIEATIRRVRRLTRDGEIIFHIEGDAAAENIPPDDQQENISPEGE